MFTTLLSNVPLAAGPGDWLGVLVPLVVTIIWVLNQVFAKINEGANQPPRRRPPRPNREPGEMGNQPPRNEPANDIESFLRRAAEVRSEREGGPQRPQSTPDNRSGGTSPRRPVRSRRPTADVIEVETPVEVELVEEKPRRLTDISKPTHEDEVQVSVTAMDAHVKQVFDHEVGGLKTTLKSEIPQDVKEDLGQPLPTMDQQREQDMSVYDEKTDIKPSGYAKMLSNPQNLRDAIIMQEILRPRSDDL